MMWLEMSRDEAHGGGDWGFTKSLWAPTQKRRGGTWPYWTNVGQVRKDDFVLHLRGKGKKAAFVGYSVAALDGYETHQRPDIPGQWASSEKFYLVHLENFQEFEQRIVLDDVFRECNHKMRTYFERNKSYKGKHKKRLFYVIQSGRLQCLNGAYLSEVDTELGEILLGQNFAPRDSGHHKLVTNVNTAVKLNLVRSRIGQADFSHEVKLNYSSQCCFPQCDVADSNFLVGAHIDRWADNANSRGDISNGLCFCLMHDRAFESGLFTIDSDFRICFHEGMAVKRQSTWSRTHLAPFNGQQIRLGNIRPALNALESHWMRIGFNQ
jgi:hypothetical protein